MKIFVYIFSLAVTAGSTAVLAQNTLPSSGNVGVGTANPRSLLQVTGNKDYFVNHVIPGRSEDSQGTNYILLHLANDGTLMDEHFVMGQVSAIRGSVVGWNRKFVVDVNTATAYSDTRGSIISYMEPSKLVTLRYQGSKYLALEILNRSSLSSFSFTGYARNEKLQLVYDQDVTDVQEFQSLDPVTVQGALVIGTNSPAGYKLAVAGNMIAESVKVKLQGNWPDYVFAAGHRLPSLAELERYIKLNQRLPEMPSAEEVQTEGIDLGEINAKLLEKIEELTLYLIEKDEQLKQQENRILLIERRLQLSEEQNQSEVKL